MTRSRVLCGILLIICRFAINGAEKWVLTVENFDASGNRVYEVGISWGVDAPWRRISVGDEVDIAKPALPTASRKSVTAKRKSASRRSGALIRHHELDGRKERKKSEKAAREKVYKVSAADDPWKHWSYRGTVLDEHSKAVLQFKDTVGSQGEYHYAHIADLQKWVNGGLAQIRMQDTKTKKHDTWEVLDPDAPLPPFCVISSDMIGFPQPLSKQVETLPKPGKATKEQLAVDSKTQESMPQFGVRMEAPKKPAAEITGFPELDPQSIPKSVDLETGDLNELVRKQQNAGPKSAFAEYEDEYAYYYDDEDDEDQDEDEYVFEEEQENLKDMRSSGMVQEMRLRMGRKMAFLNGYFAGFEAEGK